MNWDAIFGAANFVALIAWVALAFLPRWPALLSALLSQRGHSSVGKGFGHLRPNSTKRGFKSRQWHWPLTSESLFKRGSVRVSVCPLSVVSRET